MVSVVTELPTLCRPTVWFQNGQVVMLDRRKLPHSKVYVKLRSPEEVATAIERMVIQGAGSIAIAAGYGILLAIYRNRGKRSSQVLEAAKRAAGRMLRTRPTGQELAQVTAEVVEAVRQAINENKDPYTKAYNRLREVENEFRRIAYLCGRKASTLLQDGDTILTHCFPGCALYYMLNEAKKQGKKISVYATETRPYLQGARLTCLTLVEAGYTPTLITDNMVGYLMWKGLVDKVFLAADRIAMDGSIANKIGTYSIAVLAARHKVPFYVLGYEGPDPNTNTWEDMEIEERNPQEVLYCMKARTAPEGVQAYYPAFDITPPELITAIITHKGIYPPCEIAKTVEV